MLSRREETKTIRAKLLEIKEEELLWDYIKCGLEVQAVFQSPAVKSTDILLERGSVFKRTFQNSAAKFWARTSAASFARYHKSFGVPGPSVAKHVITINFKSCILIEYQSTYLDI